MARLFRFSHFLIFWSLIFTFVSYWQMLLELKANLDEVLLIKTFHYNPIIKYSYFLFCLGLSRRNSDKEKGKFTFETYLILENPRQFKSPSTLTVLNCKILSETSKWLVNFDIRVDYGNFNSYIRFYHLNKISNVFNTNKTYLKVVKEKREWWRKL